MKSPQTQRKPAVFTTQQIRHRLLQAERLSCRPEVEIRWQPAHSIAVAVAEDRFDVAVTIPEDVLFWSIRGNELTALESQLAHGMVRTAAALEYFAKRLRVLAQVTRPVP